MPGTPADTDPDAGRQPTGNVGEVFQAFLQLGLTSFGGPAAHLGYFRAELVERRGWLDERAYAELVALCQFLPGPASSQVGFGLGLLRAGFPGAVAAWAGFTLPSAVLMAAFALGAGRLEAAAGGAGALHGLKLVAVAVVAQAVWGMARTLCPDGIRAGVAVVALGMAALLPGWAGQTGAIGLGAAAGWMLCRGGQDGIAAGFAAPVPGPVGLGCLLLFGVLLAALPAWGGAAAVGGSPWGLVPGFYAAGALVFGGGHVVLPLLRDATVTPGWVSEAAFLAGYGAAQAVPGPLFTFAAYLGAVIGGVAGAALAVVAVFLPGLLLLVGVLPFWTAMRASGAAQGVVRGANAAVVGVLGAALYDPAWVGSVAGRGDFVAVAAGFVLLVVGRAPAWTVVGAGALGGTLAGVLGLVPG